MAQYGFYFDQNACAGCHTCQIACKDKNRLVVGELLRTVHSYETGDFPNVGIYHLAATCAHCTNPACVAACPTGRTVKDAQTGVVYHDEAKPCAGERCRRCVSACPYHHPVYAARLRKVVKCDMCREIVMQGGEPACVRSCMMRAIHFGPVEGAEAAIRRGSGNGAALLPRRGNGRRIS